MEDQPDRDEEVLELLIEVRELLEWHNNGHGRKIQARACEYTKRTERLLIEPENEKIDGCDPEDREHNPAPVERTEREMHYFTGKEYRRET